MRRYRFSIQLQVEEVDQVQNVFLHWKTIKVEDNETLEKAQERYRKILEVTNNA